MTVNPPFKVGYVPLVKKSWLNESLDKVRLQALEMLRGLGVEVVESGLVVEQAQADSLAELFAKERVDCLLFHHITFSLGTIIPSMATKLDAPILFWSMPEPPMEGGRLSSNSFCASNMNSHALWKMGRKKAFVYGSFEDAKPELAAQFKALKALKSLKGVKIGLVGDRVPGFYTSNFDELLLLKTFGVQVHHVDLLEVVKGADAITDSSEMEAKLKACKVSGPSPEELRKMARVFLSFKAIAAKHGLDAFAVKCWPDLEEMYGLAPCAVLGMLTDSGLTTGCEGDVYGTVTMLLERALSGGEAPFFCDMISLDFDANTGVVWHCGAAPASLKDQAQDCGLCKHSIVDGGGRMGVTNEFPLKGGRVTFARLGETQDGTGFRMLFASGEGLKTPQLLKGNPLKVKFDASLKDLASTIIEEGFEHHYSLVRADVSKELSIVCKWLGIPAVSFV